MPRRRPREIHRQQGLLTSSWLGYAPWAVLTAHCLLAIAYNLATPFGNNGYPNTPDEGAHFQYVAYVAREWRLPKFEGYAGVGYEAHQPPLYYFLAAAVYALTGGEGKAVRLLSTLCSAGVVWLVWLTLRRLAPERPLLALTGMGFAAFLPMHIAIGSAVGNDALTNLLFAAVLYALLTNLHNATASTTAPENSNPLLKVPPAGRGNRADSVPPAKREEPEKRDTHALVPLAKRGEPSPHSVPLANRGEPAGGGRLYQLFLLPILTGLTLLTKATGILLIPIMLLGILLWGWLRYRSLVPGLSMGFLALLLTLSISGWWLVRNYILYDDPLLQRTFLEVFAGTAKAQDFINQGMTWGQYAQLVADWTFRSFWFAYGAPETARTGLPNFLPSSVYLGLGALTLGAAVGFALRLCEPSPLWARVWLLLAGLCLVLTLVSFVLFVRVFFQTQGRYFYPALLTISVFWALGWERLVPERYRPMALLGITGVLLALALGCLRYLE
ncbi:glycosyltransferase family 39 protein [Synechococcus sp. RC10B2]